MFYSALNWFYWNFFFICNNQLWWLVLIFNEEIKLNLLDDVYEQCKQHWYILSFIASWILNCIHQICKTVKDMIKNIYCLRFLLNYKLF